MRTRFWRLSLLLPVLLLMSLSTALAQDSTPISIDGSDTLQPLLETLTTAYNDTATTKLDFSLAANGPNSAFTEFCNGNLNVVMSSRFMTDQEKALCDANGLQFIENVLGYEALVVLATPTLGGEAPVTCLSLDELNLVYGFSAEGKANDIQLLNPVAAASPINVYAPAVDSVGYGLLQSLLPDGQARTDATVYTSPAEVVSLLGTSETPGIAIMTLPEYESLEEVSNVSIVNIRNTDDQVCQAPNLGNLEAGIYRASRPVALYFNQADFEPLTDFVRSLSENNAAVAPVTAAGFTAAGDATYARNMNNLLEPNLGRTFSRPLLPVGITNAAAGDAILGGSSLAVDVAKAMTFFVNGNYPSVVVKLNLRGDNAGWADLCAGTADLILTSTPVPAEYAATCESNGISTYDLPIGSQAAVFVVAKKNDSLPACLTTDTLVNIFAAPKPAAAAETPSGEDRNYDVGPQNWQDLDPSYPDLPLFVLMPGQSSLEIDWLLKVAGASDRWGRSDKESNVSYGDTSMADDNAYRADATANYEGGAITVLRWKDYQNSSRKDDLTLLEVDSGNGCVAPSEATISDGSYPLATTLQLSLSRSAMKKPAVAALMWDMLSENAITRLEELGLVNVDGNQLRQRREDVFPLLEEALALAAQEAQLAATAEAIAPSSTEEAVPGATVEATAEPTEAATAEPTQEATIEPTEAATAEPTQEATTEPTEAATVEPTQEATAEPTQEATEASN